ncbi:hypothetical protein PHSY_001075 [Pseudozyma hubeiensis SY62]|uniref:Uncharacterized protein n=1 Tax=Pseudozyma hubeiensis (strain SY62) TaxID=1305764 RepID=R9P5Y0_PSEHS|nr:hypothetical protein PHSY_001075 [Pseudozyma hubeiensis SY62]GAC93510.1 hypothetical protein PHSY_001075 [Pseudozyma hubeiensis SY62]
MLGRAFYLPFAGVMRQYLGRISCQRFACRCYLDPEKVDFDACFGLTKSDDDGRNDVISDEHKRCTSGEVPGL